MSLRDKIDGNELDLSLNQLTEVPVKELAAATKATHLDLSCNRIEILPINFATLTHLVKIDLSGNRLTELPQNFGNLANLQHLDLYGNLLVKLPVSFCRLKNLRWLDLKNNPLDPELKAVAGDCLDEKQCQLCAKKVVAFMQTIEENMEREKQKKLKEIREKEAIQRAKMEKELEEQRRQKKLEKERRKAEFKAKKEVSSDNEKLEHTHEDLGDTPAVEQEVTANTSKGLLMLKAVLPIIFLMAAAFLLFGNRFPTSFPSMQRNLAESIPAVQKCIAKYYTYSIPYIINVRTFILRAVHHAMLSVSEFASNIEMLLSIYF